jgi:ATP-dependent protease ClpP protease subunit
MSRKERRKGPVEIAVVGEVDDWQKEVMDALLEVPIGGQCVFYIDSSGGSMYGALAVLGLLKHRRLQATAVVLGECSSAALWVFAACGKRQVTPFSAFLFHPMRWESDKSVTSSGAVSWARHFQQLEKDMDELLVRLLGQAGEQVRAWTTEERFVTAQELVAAGLAEMLEIA